MLLLLPLLPEQLTAYLKCRPEMTAVKDGWHQSLLQAIGWHSTQYRQLVEIPGESTEALASASQAWAEALATKTAAITSLEDRWDDTKTQADADAVAIEPLEYALTAMFALEGIYRVLDQYPDDQGVEAAATELAKAYDAYDEELLDHVGVLCTLADGDALKRLRESLPETCMTVPWWLDGALEDAAKTLTEQTDSLVEAFAKRLGDS